MKLTVLFLLIAFCGVAQFKVETFTQLDAFDMESNFPIVVSSKNPKAAEKINVAMHHFSLEKIFMEEDEERFSAVFPPEDEIWGASEFDYEVLANNENYFSIGITCAYTGAYSEYYTRNYTFNAITGQQVMISDLFSEETLAVLSNKVNSRIEKEINDFIAAADSEDEYQRDQIQMYLECLEWISDEIYPASSYYLTDSSLVVVRNRCSSHMMAALDDLWDFYAEYSFEELNELFNYNAKALMTGKPMDYSDSGVPVGKVLQGELGGKYPITMIISNPYEDHYAGVYWYDKIKKQIELDGELNDQIATLVLKESVEEKETGTFELMIISDGTLEGNWIDAKGETSFGIALKLSE